VEEDRNPHIEAAIARVIKSRPILLNIRFFIEEAKNDII